MARWLYLGRAASPDVPTIASSPRVAACGHESPYTALSTSLTCGEFTNGPASSLVACGMEFLVLGPLRVAADGRLIEISAAKPRSMLGVLLVNVNQVVSADRLLEEVWGDRQPSGGVKTLQYHVSKLRDVLEPERGRGEEGCIGTVSGGTPPERVGTGRPPHLRMNWDFWPLLGTNGLLVR